MNRGLILQPPTWFAAEGVGLNIPPQVVSPLGHLAFWIYPVELPERVRVIASRNGVGGSTGWLLRLGEDGRLGLLTSFDGSETELLFRECLVPTNAWTHVALSVTCEPSSTPSLSSTNPGKWSYMPCARVMMCLGTCNESDLTCTCGLVCFTVCV